MQGVRLKFYIGGLVIIAAVVFLIFSSTMANSAYFITVEDVLDEKNNYVDISVKLSGAIVGETIQYDPNAFNLIFEIAHIPNSNAEIEHLGGLNQVLCDAVSDPMRSRILVIYNGIKPDLLADKVQAIITGHLGNDGIFYASEILLKCPTRYEEELPSQADN